MDLSQRSWGEFCGTRRRTEPEVNLAINFGKVGILNIFLYLKFYYK